MSFIVDKNVETKTRFGINLLLRTGSDPITLHYNLGIRYLTGQKQNVSNAIDHFKVAAEGGDAESNYQLATLALSFSHLFKEGTAAHKLYLDKACEQNFPFALAKRGVNIIHGVYDYTQNPDLGYQEILRAKELANYPTIRLEYAVCLLKGYGTAKDEAAAAAIFQDLADNDKHVLAMRNLAQCYKEGLGVKEDIVAALKYFEMGASYGDAICLSNAAYLLLENSKEESEVSRGLEYLEKAVSLGQSEFYLGTLHEAG